MIEKQELYGDELLRLLDSQHLGLRSISLSEPTLDDVFLAKTGRTLAI